MPDGYAVHDQAITLEFTDSNGDNIEAVNFRVDYWTPDNQSNTASGSISAAYYSKSGSTLTVTIPVDIIFKSTESFGDYRFQPFDTDKKQAWFDPLIVRVVKKGQALPS